MTTTETAQNTWGQWLRETLFGYDAAENVGKRRVASITTRSEDVELNPAKRRQMQANANDIARNFAIAAWMLRKHLDFVSRFTFQAQTGSDLDDQLEGLMTEWQEPENCDIAARHPFERWLRLFELRATVDGDVFGVMLKSGHLQGIEGLRVRSPNFIERGDTDRPGYVHGVRVNAQNRALGYAFHRREAGGFAFEREIPAENCLHHGYFDHFDQVRGISPLSAGINQLQDVYENFDYALAKAKISQLFGIAWMRNATTAPGPVELDSPDDEEDDEEPRYKINFGQGPVAIDLQENDDFKIIESQQPSNQFREFTLAIVQVALKSLDIPFCFYDESHTNFYGSRAAVLLYIEAAKSKRKALQRHLRQITRWKMRQWYVQGKLILPSGTNFDKIPFEWIHAGLPWWDPSKDVNGDIQAINAGLRTRAEIRKERYGDDWFTVAERLKEEEDWINTLQLTLKNQLVAAIPDEEGPPTKKRGNDDDGA